MRPNYFIFIGNLKRGGVGRKGGSNHPPEPPSGSTTALSLPQQDDCLTGKGTKNHATKQGPDTKPQQPIGTTIEHLTNSNIITVLERTAAGATGCGGGGLLYFTG